MNKRGKGIHTRDGDEIPLLLCLFVLLSNDVSIKKQPISYFYSWKNTAAEVAFLLLQTFQGSTFALTQSALCKTFGIKLLCLIHY